MILNICIFICKNVAIFVPQMMIFFIAKNDHTSEFQFWPEFIGET
jgi:hypothetical protein